MYINNDSFQPDTLKEILALRPEGTDTGAKPVENLESHMKGALIGRFVGCMLGIPVEMYSVANMQAIALESGMEFPPRNYWTGTDNPEKIHYRVNKRTDYLLQNIDKVAVDDDITYVILNMLLLEKYGKDSPKLQSELEDLRNEQAALYDRWEFLEQKKERCKK